MKLSVQYNLFLRCYCDKNYFPKLLKDSDRKIRLYTVTSLIQF